MKKIMILGASRLQLPAIQKAKEMGLQVIAVDMDENAIGFEEEGVIKEIISTIDTYRVLEAALKYQINGITTICTDLPMRTVAKVAEEMNLPGITEKAAFNATEKSAMRNCLKMHGVPIPEFYIVETIEEYREAVLNFECGCVVKSPDNSGSRGIQLVSDIKDKTSIEDAFFYCKRFSRCGSLLVEEYMEGTEVCVETLNFDGRCYPIQITDQLAKKPPYFTDAGYNQPSLLPEETKKQILKVAVDANLALENYVGSSCTEIIVTKDGPKIVEVGPRLAGDYMTTDLVPLSTGVDMVEAIIKIALGEKVTIEQKYSKGSCIRYFMKPVKGVIKEIRGIDDAKKVDGIKHVEMLKGVGDIATELRSSGDRLGFVIAQKNTPEEAIFCCEKALNMIEVITE